YKVLSSYNLLQEYIIIRNGLASKYRKNSLRISIICKNHRLINIFGKVLHGIIIVEKERKKVRIFYRNFNSVIVVKNYKYFNEVAEEKSETYFASNGKIVLHFWPRYNYLLHAIRSPPKPVERILPKLELMWKADNLLLMHYQKKKKLTLENAQCYLHNHPEIVDLFYDYIHSLLQKKPEVVFSFTIKFFQNMKNTY
ncbi:uncharacterized protein LOC105232946, partial [Bactrocera dorsalis]|uniref:Uncharacterized protein LOC105232946 n=1 Tax=Bactrocera dorsalis TaxID=27457 RepID=A0A6I9VHZ1_BACDO